MEEEVIDNNEQDMGEVPKEKKGSKVASIGKYFLILVLITAQGVGTYYLIDLFYPKVYAKMNAEPPVEQSYGMYDLGSIVVNPANTNGKRILMVEISFELNKEGLYPILEGLEPKIKQQINDYLSAMNTQQLINVYDRDVIRANLKDLVNSVVGENSVRDLFFVRYVMQ
jgi:flagellar basal body-associated protein FliL